MCETRSCPHEADALCTCRALLERDNDIIGLLTHIHENMTDVEWELDYTDLSRPEKRRLCPGGQVPASAAGRLCQELDASDELAGDDFSPPFTGTFIKSTMPEGAICLPGN